MTCAGHEVDCTGESTGSCIARLGAGRPAEEAGHRFGDGVAFDPARSQVFPGILGGYPTVMPVRAGVGWSAAPEEDECRWGIIPARNEEMKWPLDVS